MGTTAVQHPLRSHDPRRIARYELLARLGQGGMGVVYLGRDASGQLVAIKTLRQELSLDESLQARFRSEVNRVQQVPPFCTAPILDADLDHDPPYLVVEYVDGPSLTDVVRQRGPLRGSELHSVALGMATALTAIHGAGVVHRDLKPDNVLLGLSGVKVIDFGIARPLESTSQHTSTGQMVGTVAYMAPERFDDNAGRGADPAGDIFAWGAVLAYAATGRTPFAADSAPATAMRILTQPPDLNGVPEPVRALVQRALHKDPRQRPSARDLLNLLLPGGQLTEAAPVAKQPGVRDFVTHQLAPVPAPDRPARRRRGVRWVAVGSAVLVTLAVLAAVGLPRLLSDRTRNPQQGTAAAATSPVLAATTATSPPTVEVAPPPFSFTVRGWTAGLLRVSDPVIVSTAYQMAAIQNSDKQVVGVLTVFHPGAYDPETLTGAEQTTVAGRPAKWHGSYTPPGGVTNDNKVLAWQYADDAWAMLRTYSIAPSVGQMRTLAAGLTMSEPTPAKMPFTMSYVPPGYRPVEVAMHTIPTESGVVGIHEGDYGGAVFARPAPKPTGLQGPWDPRPEGPIADNFVIFVVRGETVQRTGPPQCRESFCFIWAGDGRVRIEVVTTGGLPDREAIKILKGMELASVSDDSTWTETRDAVPVAP